MGHSSLVLVLWHTRGWHGLYKARQDVWARLCGESHLQEYLMEGTLWKTWRAGPCFTLAKIVTTSRKVTGAASVSTRSNCCQQIHTNHQAHFSGPDFAHNRDCCYHKTRHNEDIFFQSYCTTPENTVRLYNVRSATNAPHCSHHWMIRGECLSTDTFPKPWPLDLRGWYSPWGTASANSVLYLIPKFTEDLVSQ